LPSTILRAVQVDKHKGADYSATQILNSPRIIHLTKRHESEIEIDASDRLWSLRGQAIHSIIERGSGPDDISELYMEHEVEGIKLSGTLDLLTREGKKTILYDYKDTSAWTIIYGSRLEEWEKQVNIYHWLLRKTKNIIADEIKVVAFIRDWNKSDSQKVTNYPEKVCVLPIRIWAEGAQQTYIEERIKFIEEYKDKNDNELLVCSAKERWAKDTTWAVMRDGRKSAVKVCHTELEALNMIADMGKNHSIEHRPGRNIRCEEYCDCNKFCNFYLKEVKKSEISF